MFKILLKVHKYLFAKAKIKYLLLLLFSIGAIAIETLGYISIFPLITLLLNPSYLDTSTFLTSIYNYIGSQNVFEFTLSYGIISISLFLISSTLSFFATMLQIKFVNKIVFTTRKNLLSNYLERNFTFHKKSNSSTLISKLFTQVDETGQLTFFGFFELLISTVSLIIFLIIFLIVSWKTTLYSFVSLLLFYIIIDYNLKKKIKKIASVLYSSNISGLTFASEAIKLVKEAIFPSQKLFFLKRFENEIFKIFQARNFVRIVPRLSRFLIETLAIGSIITVTLLLYKKNLGITEFLETLILFGLSIYKIFPSINKCFQININIKSASFQLFSILDDLENKEYKENISEETGNYLFKEKIEFKNIDFYYDKKILKNINIVIEKNKNILIYGKSGSGKTTICDLISGHLIAQSGEIIIDGKKISSLNYQNYKKFFGYVSQEALILNEDFYRNISLEENFDKEKIEEISKIARIDEFIKSKPNGYNEVISENGKNLSGGQKQRISIARALYHNPEIIIMDEGTSNLDTVTEKEIYKLIYEKFIDKTKIIISHRMNNFIKFDLCYKIQDGEVIYEGKEIV